MGAGTASEPRTPPTAIQAAGGFVVEAADIHGHALEHEGGAFAGGLAAARGKFVEEFLMAVYRARGASCPEFMLEKNGRTQVGLLYRAVNRWVWRRREIV